MKAVVYHRYGSPRELRVEDVPTPAPGPGDVLVKVHASSLNAADLEYLYGIPFATRLGSGIVRPRRQILGLDIAGVVVEVGEQVTDFRAGDAVCADLFDHGFGAFAEFACAPEKAFAPVPPSLTLEEAATVPHSGILAIQGLKQGKLIKPGQRVLINGAGGCVGPFAIQMAKAFGATVTAVDQTEKLDFVRSVGADYAIDYTSEDYTRSGKTYDWILDLAAHRPLVASRRALSKHGSYIMAGGPFGRFFRLLVAGPLLTLGTSRKMTMLMWKPFHPPDVTALMGLLESKKVKPLIDRAVPLDGVPDALYRLQQGKARGKVVIRIATEGGRL